MRPDRLPIPYESEDGDRYDVVYRFGVEREPTASPPDQ